MQSSSAESEKLVWYNTLQQKRKGVKNMKILHLSDLNLGRRLYHHSFLPQQEKMLEQVVKIAVEQSVQAVLIAGDVYDKNVPAAEAVTVLDSFLTALSEKKIAVFLISGCNSPASCWNTRACISPGRFPVRCRVTIWKMNTEKCISACCPL